MKIRLQCEQGADSCALDVLAARWGLEHDDTALMALVLTAEGLELRKCDEPKLGGIRVDFAGGTMAHRRRFGGGRGEAVAKAAGLRNPIFRQWWTRQPVSGVMPLCWRRWAVMCG